MALPWAFVSSDLLLREPVSARAQRVAAARPLWLIGLGVLLYSTGPVFVAASSVPGPVFSLWRLWLGVPVLALAAALQGRGRPRPDRRALRWPLWAGLAFGAHQLLFMTAIKATSVTDVSLMNTLAPLLVAVAAVPLFGERPGAGFRVWSLLAIAGAGVVVLGAATGPSGNLGGMLLAIANVVFFGVFFLLSKLSRPHIAVLPFLLGVILVAAVAVSAFAVVTAQPVAAIGTRDLLLALAVAAGPGTVGHFVSTWPLRWVPANVPPVMRLAQPVAAGGLAWLFLGQPVTGAHLLGGVLTIAGVCGALLTPGGRRLRRDALSAAPH